MIEESFRGPDGNCTVFLARNGPELHTIFDTMRISPNPLDAGGISRRPRTFNPRRESEIRLPIDKCRRKNCRVPTIKEADEEIREMDGAEEAEEVE